jgi:hypothetical protein
MVDQCFDVTWIERESMIKSALRFGIPIELTEDLGLTPPHLRVAGRY